MMILLDLNLSGSANFFVSINNTVSVIATDTTCSRDAVKIFMGGLVDKVCAITTSKGYLPVLLGLLFQAILHNIQCVANQSLLNIEISIYFTGTTNILMYFLLLHSILLPRMPLYTKFQYDLSVCEWTHKCSKAEPDSVKFVPNISIVGIKTKHPRNGARYPAKMTSEKYLPVFPGRLFRDFALYIIKDLKL